MLAFIYARSYPNDGKVCKSDRIRAQNERCEDFARELNLVVKKRFSDQGTIHPINLAPNLSRMIEDIRQSDQRIVVMTDHIQRFGNSQTTLKVLNELSMSNALLIPIFSKDSTSLTTFYQALIKEQVK